MDVYVVHTGKTGSDLPIGVYSDKNRAQEEADSHAAGVFGKVQTIPEHTSEEIEMRNHFVKGKPVGCHTIFRFALDK
jgi:hypothetical protein